MVLVVIAASVVRVGAAVAAVTMTVALVVVLLASSSFGISSKRLKGTHNGNIR
jgi:hypothetical protein